MYNQTEGKSVREQILERMHEEARLAYEIMEKDSILRNNPNYLPITTYILPNER
jgi:hypothetical protein